MSYIPALRFGTAYCPTSLLTAFLSSPVLTFFTVTEAPARTAPEESLTVPTTPDCCECADKQNPRSSASTHNFESAILRQIISTPHRPSINDRSCCGKISTIDVFVNCYLRFCSIINHIQLRIDYELGWITIT